MRCIICDSDSWTNVDQYRIAKKGMCVCDNCGFISYPDKWKSKDEIISYYRKEYRNPPNSGNYYTGQRKLHFHSKFLNEVFSQWKKDNKNKPIFGEIGSAYGMVLHWLKQVFPEAEVNGTEITNSYKANAFHEFGLILNDELPNKKHDMIISYKVLEHQLDADKELLDIKSKLCDDGLLYISVPTWFDTMGNFGLGGFDLEYYYEVNHINVWTREMFEYLLNKSGFEIIKSDYKMYDSTYLCKINNNIKCVEHNFSKDKTIENLRKFKESYDLTLDGKWEEALNIYNNFPTAWANYVELNRKRLFEEGWDSIRSLIDRILEVTDGHPDMYVLASDLAMRSEKFHEAIKYAEIGLNMKPENPPQLLVLINSMRELGLRASKNEEKIHYFTQARNIARHLREVSHQHFREALDLVYFYNAHLPTPAQIQ